MRAHIHTSLAPQRIFIDALPPATLVLVTTTPFARSQLQSQLEHCPHLRLLASSDSPVQAIPLTMLHRPDILLIAHHAPSDSLLPLLTRLKQTLDGLAIILCLPNPLNHSTLPDSSSHSTNPTSPTPLDLPCEAILTPPHTSKQLALAIEAVSCGYTVHTTAHHIPTINGHAAIQTITARERDILKLLCQGLNNREIAQRLFLAESTIKSHTARLKSKLCVHNRIGLALAAMRYGLA